MRTVDTFVWGWLESDELEKVDVSLRFVGRRCRDSLLNEVTWCE